MACIGLTNVKVAAGTVQMERLDGTLKLISPTAVPVEDAFEIS